MLATLLLFLHRHPLRVAVGQVRRVCEQCFPIKSAFRHCTKYFHIMISRICLDNVWRACGLFAGSSCKHWLCVGRACAKREPRFAIHNPRRVVVARILDSTLWIMRKLNHVYEILRVPAIYIQKAYYQFKYYVFNSNYVIHRVECPSICHVRRQGEFYLLSMSICVSKLILSRIWI